MNLKITISFLAVCFALGAASRAQEQADQKQQVTIFPHWYGRFWLSGQMNFIFQSHGDFPARYTGPHSLKNTSENAISSLLTLYTGVEITRGTELLFDVESTGGHGISDALGLAGFTNLDVVRNPGLGAKPYIARIMLHQTIALSKAQVEQERTALAMAKSVARRRLEVRAGKLSLADFFDTNAVGSDSHLQFTNWTTVQNGAYDYAADTRGYTYGVMLEYQQPRFGVRFGEMLMPKVANGIDLVWNLRRAHSESLEFELRPALLHSRATAIRALSYWNTANMGDYRQAITAFKSGVDATPNIEAHRHQGSRKHGFGLNIEQELPAKLRAFFRAGWNEGRHESFAYTEVDSTLSFGLDLGGERWHRKLDKLGSAFVTNGLSGEHAEYLRLGGQGFLLGDGNLRYGREDIWETYYTTHIWRGMFFSGQVQFIANPGYNQERTSLGARAAAAHGLLIGETPVIRVHNQRQRQRKPSAFRLLRFRFLAVVAVLGPDFITANARSASGSLFRCGGEGWAGVVSCITQPFAFFHLYFLTQGPLELVDLPCWSTCTVGGADMLPDPTQCF